MPKNIKEGAYEPMKKKILRAGCFTLIFAILLLSMPLTSYAVCGNDRVLVTGQTFSTFSGTQYNMYTHNHIYSDDELDYIDDCESWSSVITLQERSANYNCHSYAWYSQDIDNNHYWMEMDGLAAYLNDPHTISIDTPEAGCIIVYWIEDPMVTSGYYFEHGEPVHSGIVDSIYTDEYGIEVIQVISKWGIGGLYKHSHDIVPDEYGAWDDNYESYVHVTYYKLENSHSYEYSRPSNPAQLATSHIKTCTGCGKTHNEGHTFSSMPTGRFKCIYCGYTTTSPGAGIASVGDESDQS